MNSTEIKLWEAFEAGRSDESRNALAVYYLPWIEEVARKYHAKLPDFLLEVEEMINDAAPALLQCINRFDRSTGFEFATFALLRIRGAMTDQMRDRDWVPRLQRSHAKMHPCVVVKMFPLSSVVASRRRAKSMPSGDYRDTIEFDPASKPQPNKVDDEEFWRTVCRPLSKTSRLAVLMYFRMGLTMNEIGKSIGVSESRISQLISQTMALMRENKRIQALNEERKAA